MTISLLSCNHEPTHFISREAIQAIDKQKIEKMIAVRERGMIEKDLAPVMNQFSENATWINSQGYYFEGKPEIEKFHIMMFNNDSLHYEYIAGKPKVRLTDTQNAVAYYGWQMNWINRFNTYDTVKKEIGLMTLTAQKEDSTWHWKAVTNQHTPWFYDRIEPVFID